MRLHVPFKIIARLICCFIVIATASVLLGTGYFNIFSHRHYDLIHQNFDPKGSLPPLSPCSGPRGTLLTQSADDSVKPHYLDRTYPDPLGGSYDAVGLEKSWMTADERYGPYGYGEDREAYSRSRVDWDKVEWASLQDNCVARNQERFPGGTELLSPSRLSLPSWKTKIESKLPGSLRPRPRSTGRTALVVRSWDGHKFRTEDKLFLRSLIVEAALSSGGQYAVYLLIDVHDRARGIFQSDTNYKAAVEEIVPKEFQSIAVLFDGSLLDAWYPKVKEHIPMWQVFQPLQLFAQTYDKFDHYWNIEMDIRFTGNSYEHLEAISRFARDAPRKQSFERASFFFIPGVHGTYQEFIRGVNTSVQGEGLWNPPSIPEIGKPVGPRPPVPRAIDDAFTWGHGEDADFISMVPCSSVHSQPRWFGYNYITGLKSGISTPRFLCPQAVGRASRKLLDAIHTAQADKGISVPSEATLPSFAYWHGLKISFPPHPYFVNPPTVTAEHMNEMINGDWPPTAESKGFSNGTIKWNDSAFDEFFTVDPTWRWTSRFPTELMQAWLAGENVADGKLPYLLRRHKGKVYAPNLALHPVKTEGNL